MFNGARETPGEELARRIRHLAWKEAQQPILGSSAQLDLRIGRVRAYIRFGGLSIFLLGIDAAIYREIPLGRVTDVHDAGIAECVRILREHMILDDLANV